MAPDNGTEQARSRVVMLVDNEVTGDSRVQKTAQSMSEAGWDVVLLGCAAPESAKSWRLGRAEVRVLPLPAPGPGGGMRSRLVAQGGWALRLARLARRPMEHAQVWFWQAVAGDRAWRRLEPGLWNYERTFGPVIDQLAPDIIHANDFRMLGVGARARRRGRANGRRIKLVWDAHEFLPGVKPGRANARWLPAHRGHEREYAGDADRVVTVSPTLAGMLQREHRLVRRPAVVLNAPPGDAATAASPGPDLRERCGLDDVTPLIVYSGSPTPQRGLATAVEALPLLPGVHLALVVNDPDGPHVRAVLSMASRLRVADRVHVHGYVPHDQVVQFLSSADAGLIPIHHWPNHEIALITKFFEYSMARLPIVVSDVKTMAETVRQTGQGEVFRARDATDFARGVRAVLAHPRRYRDAYDRPDSPLPHWTWEAQAKVLDGIYHDLIADRVPDVSVIVPVYNTMPYLRQCLDSLARQSIGLDRMEIIAVDDGSTDGSGRELDRFARRHPGTVTVIHQENSGGPAGPCNRALDVATGRYVFFVGADDRLGTQALERLVDAADTYGSDVVLGKVVGVHSRFIYQDVFARNEVDIGLFDSPLPRSLANTKLFRRNLIERHGTRYREDLAMGSDLPFTLEACFRAGRISVLADYDFYYAVRRHGASNITYRSRHLERLEFIEKSAAFIAELIEPGKRRDAVLARRFDHEVAKLVDDDFLQLDRETAQLVRDGVARLAAEHLSDGVAAELNAQTRVRLAVARDGGLDDLLAVIGQDARVGVPATVLDGDHRYAAYPGFRDRSAGPPDACFEVTDSPDWAVKLDATSIAWELDATGDRLLTITARSPLSELAQVTVSAEEIPGTVHVTSSGSGSEVRISFRVAELLDRSDPSGQRRSITAQPGPLDLGIALGAMGARGLAAVRAPGLRRFPSRVMRRGARLVAVVPARDASGRLMISVTPLTFARIWARARRIIGD